MSATFPAKAPTVTTHPTISTEPTPGPTDCEVFEEKFLSRDIGNVAYSGQSFEVGHLPGLYTIKDAGSSIPVSCG